jgi:hypothetical protein
VPGGRLGAVARAQARRGPSPSGERLGEGDRVVEGDEDPVGLADREHAPEAGRDRTDRVTVDRGDHAAGLVRQEGAGYLGLEGTQIIAHELSPAPPPGWRGL